MSENIKILYAITTYDAYAYVDLSITMHKKFGNDVIVVDDGSCSEKLYDVCLKHKVPLLNLAVQPAKKFDQGDVYSTVQAIQYAYSHGYTHVVKQSRRWICLDDPTPSLIRLINNTGGFTFSNITTTWGFGFRTQFCGYYVDAWKDIVKKILRDIRQRKGFGLVEHYIHVFASENQPDNQIYKKYIESHPVPEAQSGYIHWQWMGNDKAHTPKYILWHNCNNEIDYYQESKNAGLNYELNDFKIIDSHKQKQQTYR